MLPILNAAQMRQIDRETIEVLGLPGAALMESAGRAVMKAIGESPLAAGCCRPVVLCGRGNNGGDGFVVARYLQDRSQRGFPIVLLCGKLEELSGAAALMARVALNCGVKVLELGQDNLHELAGALGSGDMVVDGLLGSGASGAPRGLVRRVIEMLDEYPLRVVAIDCPSGVEMDTGRVPGVAVSALFTVTFGFEKIGHRLYPGRSHCGEVVLADIGFPSAAVSKVNFKLFAAEPSDIRNHLPLRRPDSHKGNYGKVLVLGGSTGLTGAPVMASEAALACGAGLVTAGVPAGLNAIFETKLTEAMTLPLPDGGRGALQPEALEPLLEFLAGSDVLALGPGLGRDPGTRRLIHALAPKIACPAVIDADGLYAFAEKPESLSGLQAPVVITPHPGEMARLTGLSVEDIKSRPIEVALDFAAARGTVVLLKGAPTVVAEPGGKAVLNPTGGPALSKGGSGDVLTGVIAALLAQGLPAFEAAYCGAYIHGLAGDLAAAELGQYSVLATDIIGALGAALGEIQPVSAGN